MVNANENIYQSLPQVSASIRLKNPIVSFEYTCVRIRVIEIIRIQVWNAEIISFFYENDGEINLFVDRENRVLITNSKHR